jgi:hypothetical protein
LTIENNRFSFENVEFKIIDVLGKIVSKSFLSGNTNTQNIDIQQLTSGIYFLQISKKGEIWTRKFMKE